MTEHSKEDIKKAKSGYRQKLRRKLGNGPIDPRWQWWNEGSTPRIFSNDPSTKSHSRPLVLVPPCICKSPHHSEHNPDCTRLAYVEK